MSSYMYAVVADPTLELDDVRGIAGEPVRGVTTDGLTCVVSEVDAAEFDETRLGGDVPDLAWLERVARAHDGVVRAVAAQGPVVPLRLGLLCSDDAAVAQRLQDVGDTVREVLRRTAGHEEWGVKIVATAGRRPEPVAAAAASGTSYLQQRRAALQQQERSSADAAAEADAAFTELAARAAAARRYPVQDPRLTDAGGPMLLNATFLVACDDREAFRAAADQLADARPGGDVTVTGPWPPYSFTSLDEA